MDRFQFTFKKLQEYFRVVIKEGYEIITCETYAKIKENLSHKKIFVNRVDVDFSLKKAKRIAEIFNELNIKGTFFIRLHAPEYNPFSFENFKILKLIRDSGHEIGYHSEVIDEAAIWNESAEACLKRDIDILNRMLDIKIVGVASHGGMTGLNNLDFWKDEKASDFGLLYEAYDTEPGFDLFNHAFYVSDSSWTYWKCYQKGKSCEGDRRNLAEHAKEGHPLIYSLIHSDTYYDEHFYE